MERNQFVKRLQRLLQKKSWTIILAGSVDDDETLTKIGGTDAEEMLKGLIQGRKANWQGG